MILFLPWSLGAEDRLQTDVNEIMRDRSGAVIVANPTTGEIMAVWNRPVAFDNAFPPGSTAKLVTSAMALENKLISPDDRIHCRRLPPLLGEGYHCSHPDALGPFTLTTALAYSCNYFFAALSTRLNAATLTHGFALFGLGTSAGAGSGNARASLRVSAEPAAKARAAIGEYPVLVTPAELLQAYSAVATRGKVQRLSRGNGKPSQILRTIRFEDSTWSVLTRGFEECVRSGTCQAANVPGVRVAGKTGTAGLVDGSGITQAWFVGYAPAELPEVAIVVLLSRGTGSRDAAPIAGRILQAYFASRGKK